MGDVIIKFLSTNGSLARLITEDEKRIVKKDEATEYFLTTFLDDEVYKYGMTMIRGLNKKYKFIISDKDDNRVIIENVDENDPCFPALEHAATIKVDKRKRAKGLATLAALATAGVLYFKVGTYPEPVDPDKGATTEGHNYKEDYKEMEKYYRKLIKGEISPAEVFVFEDIVNYYMNNNSNLAEEDVAFIRRCNSEIIDYNLRIGNVSKPYTR